LVEKAFAQKVDGPAKAGHFRAALGYVEAALQVYDPQQTPFDFDKASALREELLAALQGA
jgi:hypothetical protein